MMVYVMKRLTGGYKIGCTNQTLKQRWPSRAARLDIVLTVDGDFALEAKLHQQFAGRRMLSFINPNLYTPEVFDLTEDDIQQLLALPGAQRYQEGLNGRTERTKALSAL
jgi:hypothetical protein